MRSSYRRKEGKPLTLRYKAKGSNPVRVIVPSIAAARAYIAENVGGAAFDKRPVLMRGSVVFHEL